MATPDYAGVEDSIKQGYDAQRQKAAQAEAGNLQGQRDALARRQAQLGGGPGGAFVKAEQQAGNESAQRGQQANASINDAQAAELRGLKMTELGQQYGTSERLGSQDFAAGQQAKTFAHEDTAQQTGIQAAAQQQQAGIEAQKAMQAVGITAQSSLQDRQLAAQELMQKTGISSQEAMQKVGITAQADLQASEQKFQNEQGNANRNTMILEAQKDRDVKVNEFLQTIGLSREQFQEQTGVDMFNEKIAQQMADKKDMLEKTFDQFGMNKIKNMFQGASGNGTTADTGNVLGGVFKGLGGIFG